MTGPTSHEAAMLSRALAEGRSLASVAGVPETSLRAARELARWAEALGETGLARAAWEGCAALDDAAASWLGLAALLLETGEVQGAFEAARWARSRRDAGPAEQARASLICARACVAVGRADDALAWLDVIGPEADQDVRRLVRAMRRALRARVASMTR